MVQPAYGARYCSAADSGSGGGDDDGVFHGAVLFELAHHVGDGGSFLADGHINAEEVLALLVDDVINSDGGLAGLAVANDQLALATTDRTMESTHFRPVCTGWKRTDAR